MEPDAVMKRGEGRVENMEQMLADLCLALSWCTDLKEAEKDVLDELGKTRLPERVRELQRVAGAISRVRASARLAIEQAKQG